MSHQFSCDCPMCHYGETHPAIDDMERCRECNKPIDHHGMCRDCDICDKAELSAELELEQRKDERK